MMRKSLTLCLLALVLWAGTSFGQAPVVNPGWEVFVIREGATEAPFIVDNDDYIVDSIEIGTTEGSQKAGLATNLLNGATVSQIGSLHIDRLDDVPNSGSLYGPYFNIWITDGAGHYAVIANEPSNAEWAGDPWDVADWNDLRTKTCKVYETPGSNDFTSWVHNYAGIAGPLTFEDVAGLVIAPPSPAYIQDVANGVGGGAPDVLGTDVAYGYTWVFGDTAANYVSGGDGFIVNNYSATKATGSVHNLTQSTSYDTIEAALAAAFANDVINIGNGIYNPPSTLSITIPLTITGESESGVIINIPAAGGYGVSVSSANVTLGSFTLVAAAGNVQYPIHASGTANPLGLDNLTIQNVTITGAHQRASCDVHGYNNVLLSHVTANDSWGGNGVQITGCVDVVVNNISTLNNAWGSMAIYCSDYLHRPSSDLTFDGATLFLDGAFFSQDEFGFTNSDIVVTGWTHLVKNSHFREALGESDSETYTFFAPNQATAYSMALSFTGYTMYSAMFSTPDDQWEVLPGMTIQAAVYHAASDDLIDVAAGTYVETSQLVLDKDLTISGAGSGATVIAPGYNTTAGYVSTSALIYIDYGVEATIKNLAIDGTGFNVNHAIQSRGTSLAVQNCEIRDIYSSIYDGRGIVFLTGAGLVENCVMTNIQRIGVHVRGAVEPVAPVVEISGLNYTGKGTGDFLDYGIEFGGGGQGTIDGCTITACEGVASTDGSDSAGILVTDFFGTFTIADITNSVVTGNSSGIVVGYAPADISDVSITGCDLSGNPTAGVSSTGVTVDAIGNWWGHATGPYDNNDDTGSGGLYNPLGQGVPVTDNVMYNPWVGMAGGSIDPAATGPLNCSQTITLTFNFTADEYTPDMFLYNAVVSATAGLDFGAVVDLEPFTDDNNYFFAVSSGAEEMTITGSTVGNPSHPVTGAGTIGLFTITFSATGDVNGQVVFESLVLRDPDNNTIPVNFSGATIVYDCTAPDAVTAITADPHHNRVEVSWTHDGTDVDHYEVFSGLWHDGAHASVYPEYDDFIGNKIPTRPADYDSIIINIAGEWDPLGNVAALTTDEVWANADDRGVYYYEVFAVDAAGNASPRAAANDRATNYWLGDMDAIGEVAVYDMGFLGAAFGTTEGDGAYQAIADVGPTDNWSRLGIPTTDNDINFEDLMVFSMNYGIVGPANKSDVNISTVADLSWVSYDENTYALRLNDASGLKGVHLRATLPEGASVTVTAGDLLDQQSEMTFLRNIGQDLDVSLAVTGVDNGFTGQGDLFLVECTAELKLEDLIIDLRGSDNSSMEVSLDSDTGTLTPRVFGLNAAYPNPFNPMTKISFSLPETQAVRLNVYGIDGKLVTTLVNETRGAGLHEVIWNGQNDAGQVQASGLYFYRIEAGPYSQVRKMTLMK